MKFRNDIQILRGLSVFFVVLFHLGFEQLQSGFLGVDVFFVISGFLMAVLYDYRSKKLFFERRIKRLLPPYFAVILVTVIASFIINTPNETKQVSEQSMFGAFFLSNLGFWLQNSYFSKAEFNPLLHLWSLGVEIQFYIIVPLLAWFFRKSKAFLPIFLSSSLFLCIIMVSISPKTAFFMLPFRLWEFLIGFGVAAFLTNNGSIKYKQKEYIGAIGLITLIMIPFFKVNGQAFGFIDGHPGLSSLFVCFSTALILCFGLPIKLENTIIGKTTIWLGKYSYSIYLAHFPIIVIYLSKPFGGTILTSNSYMELISIVLLIFIFSYFLHHLFEARKFNHTVKLMALSSLIAFISPLPLSYFKNLSMSDDESKIFAAFSDRSEYRCGKLVRILNPKAISCELTNVNEPKKTIMLIGNSHADSIKTAFSEIAQHNDVRLLFLIPNNPLMDNGGLSANRVFKDISSKKVDHIVIHFSTEGYSLNNIKKLIGLSKKSDISVTILEPVPRWGKHIPQYMYNKLKGNGGDISKTREEYLNDNHRIFEGLNNIDYGDFDRVSVTDVFCKDDCQFSSKDGIPFYFDTNHLTLTGSRELNNKIHNIVVKHLP
ncbi:acyltransferase [Vibrio sp. 404]|uniref:Acyltransferase n=1 Tax=Vibrio marinisediminis TaxID=2758441 RepID=A0A7W2FMH1_9VIBR|nr:acyltransferase family protein [Vibrio marinisediminis]MBA5760831.1 acyltransferase [Vibrio marinisediminis]